MVKKYIVMQDDIVQEVSSSPNPISSTAVKDALATKVDIKQGDQHAGKFLKVDSTGNVVPYSVGTMQSDWNVTDQESLAYIKNKPFKTVGTGLNVVSNALVAETQLHYELFTDLPDPSESYAQVIALVLKMVTETGNIYKEYICINAGSPEVPLWAWDQIGETSATVTVDQDAEGIKINNTALQHATVEQTGLLDHDDYKEFKNKQEKIPSGTPGDVLVYTDQQGVLGSLGFDTAPTVGSNKLITSNTFKLELNKKEDVSNKVFSWSSSPSNINYPSELLVHTSLEKKVNKEGYATTDAGKVLAIGSDGMVTAQDTLNTLPTASDASGIVYYDNKWNVQEGYGYIRKTSYCKNKEISGGAYSTDGWLPVAGLTMPDIATVTQLHVTYVYNNETPTPISAVYTKQIINGEFYFGAEIDSSGDPSFGADAGFCLRISSDGLVVRIAFEIAVPEHKALWTFWNENDITQFDYRLINTDTLVSSNLVGKTNVVEAINSKVPIAQNSSDVGKVLAVGYNGSSVEIVPTTLTTLPNANKNGTAAIYVNGIWKAQEGYGYGIETATSLGIVTVSFPATNMWITASNYILDGSAQKIKVSIAGKDYTFNHREDTLYHYYGAPLGEDGSPTLSEAYPICIRASKDSEADPTNDYYYGIAGDLTISISSVQTTYTKIDSKLLPAIPSIKAETLSDGCLLLYNASSADYSGTKINELRSQSLTTSDKTFVGAINEQAGMINGLRGGVTVKVVAMLPSPLVNNTLYYVGTVAPYHAFLYVNDTSYDMGTTATELGDYVKKASIADDLTTEDTTKVLSAKQGKVLADTLDTDYVKKVNDTAFSIKGHNKILTNNVENDLLYWDNAPLTTNTKRNVGLSALSTSARWNINVSSYQAGSSGYICEERTVGGKRTIDGKERTGIIKVSEVVNLADSTSFAKEEFIQLQNDTQELNVWVNKVHYGATGGKFDGTPTYTSDWVKIDGGVADNLVTNKTDVALSAKQGLVLQKEKQDRYVGKDKALQNVIVGKNGYLTTANATYSIRIYKNKAEVAGTGVVELYSTKAGEDVSTVAARLKIIKNFARHCLVKKGMKKITYVDEDNFAKTKDGKSTVVFDGTNGDFMLEVDTIYWKCYNTTNYYEWKFSTYEFDDGCVSAHLYDGRYRKHRYYSVFLPSLDSDKCLRSIYVAGNQYLDTSKNLYTYARNNGTDMGTENTYGNMTLPDATLLIILHMFLYGTKNIQSVAKGRCDAIQIPINDGFATTNGWTVGTTADYSHGCTTLGITNLYNGLGLFPNNTVSDYLRVYCEPDAAKYFDITNYWGALPSTWVNTGVSMPNVGASYPFIKDIYGECSYMPFGTRTTGASENTYFCDGIISANSRRVFICFGSDAHTSACGLFYNNTYHPQYWETSIWANRLTICSVD